MRTSPLNPAHLCAGDMESEVELAKSSARQQAHRQPRVVAGEVCIYGRLKPRRCPERGIGTLPNLSGI
jgi:hypothetical protein